MLRTLRAVRFLFMAPVLLLVLFIVSRVATPGGDWFRWAAMGIGIAWIFALFRVVSAIVVIGGLAAFVMWLRKRDQQGGSGSPLP
jgi:hypothetical protein